ncbi:hypothetical protein [Burkholderia vietnamiensis]|uniref:hypothetical protein n=1 Tax=Burkholderia vietnamiensis TaxID=60552 RepID=UPI001592B824|nr:hypothetical protein [Burkholderia vietnamiensis]
MTTDSGISVFRDPPTQAEIEQNLRSDKRRLTTGEKVMLGPGVLGIEVLVGAAIDACNGGSNLLTGRNSSWDAMPGAMIAIGQSRFSRSGTQRRSVL